MPSRLTAWRIIPSYVRTANGKLKAPICVANLIDHVVIWSINFKWICAACVEAKRTLAIVAWNMCWCRENWFHPANEYESIKFGEWKWIYCSGGQKWPFIDHPEWIQVLLYTPMSFQYLLINILHLFYRADSYFMFGWKQKSVQPLEGMAGVLNMVWSNLLISSTLEMDRSNLPFPRRSLNHPNMNHTIYCGATFWLYARFYATLPFHRSRTKEKREKSMDKKQRENNRHQTHSTLTVIVVHSIMRTGF